MNDSTNRPVSGLALVTGATGYLGTQLLAALLRDGHAVRAVVRRAADEDDLRAAVRRGGADDTRLECAAAELTSDDGWASAVRGVSGVYHTASPIPPIQPTNPDDLIVPARDGTLRVLRAARDAGCGRIVLTSSFAAVGYSDKPIRDYTEEDWTDPDAPGLQPYPRSKTIAERAAWNFIDAEGGGLELTVINPTFILGPSLTSGVRSSLAFVKALIDGTMRTVPKQRFGIVDVRDVAELHLLAMGTPQAAGRRYLAVGDGPTTTFLELAHMIRDLVEPRGIRIDVEEAPGESLAPLTIHNDRACAELRWNPRAPATTVRDSVTALLTSSA